ncbi:hypothetical protein GCM10022280_24170 [Sphingomonas swuensis]|uniref:SPOR domain-containing protein n=1 Tax=Sphingomonas swuensis TaxID=977800 RepID=A0ABP7T8N3_9SPHN
MKGMDGEPLPWLEPVDDEDEPPALSARKMLAAILVVLLAAALVAGTLWWVGRNSADEGTGAPELIKAEPGPYKVRPSDPGGINVAGDSETAFATGAGEKVDGQLDLDAMPETPVARPQPKATTPAPAEEEEPASTEQPEAAAPSGPSGSTVQLGFYDNPSQANAAWTSLSGRFPALAGAGKVVVPFQKGQRLRASFASPDEARRACQLLKAAGDACFVVR